MGGGLCPENTSTKTNGSKNASLGGSLRSNGEKDRSNKRNPHPLKVGNSLSKKGGFKYRRSVKKKKSLSAQGTEDRRVTRAGLRLKTRKSYYKADGIGKTRGEKNQGSFTQCKRVSSVRSAIRR